VNATASLDKPARASDFGDDEDDPVGGNGGDGSDSDDNVAAKTSKVRHESFLQVCAHVYF
jgi:hypothetical protein